MGHKGDIEATYSTNKKLSSDVIDRRRESYKACLPLLETQVRELTPDGLTQEFRKQ